MTILHGTCLLKGNHPPGSDLARECPVAKRERRSTAMARTWAARHKQAKTPPILSETHRDSAPPKNAGNIDRESDTSNTVLRRIGAGRAFKPGRPRLSDAERLQRRRDRDRAHRKGNGGAPAA